MADNIDYLELDRIRSEKMDEMFRIEFADMFTPWKWNDMLRKPEVSISEGWFGLIHDMCAEIRLCQTKPYSIRFFQVKEKFGALRVYPHIDERSEIRGKIEKILVKYEVMSIDVCEVCGEPGKPRPVGWVKTLCEKHHLEREESRQNLYVDGGV
jgi:hypothetical protein